MNSLARIYGLRVLTISAEQQYCGKAFCKTRPVVKHFSMAASVYDREDFCLDCPGYLIFIQFLITCFLVFLIFSFPNIIQFLEMITTYGIQPS